MPRALQPELVPQPLWGVSAHKLLKSAWTRRIRPQVIDEAGGRCECCGNVTPRMFAHEEWSYDENEGVATILELALICQDCNSVTHFGRLPGEYVETALSHLASVNGITREQAEAVTKEALGVWSRRSGRAWSVAVSPSVVERFPDMATLPERAAALIAADRGSAAG